MVASVEYHTNFHTGSYGGVQHPSQGSWGARSVVALAMTAVVALHFRNVKVIVVSPSL